MKYIFKNKENWKIYSKKVTYYKDYILTIQKLIFGIIAHSSFMWINALYNCFIGVSRHLCIKNIKENEQKQSSIYIKVAILLILASIVYGLYNSIQLFGGKTIQYHSYICIGIAAFTFFEFGLTIKELIAIRKKKNLMTRALIFINLSSICTSFVITQVVLTSMNSESNAFMNGISAISFGAIIFLIGIYMLLHKKT